MLRPLSLPDFGDEFCVANEGGLASASTSNP